MSSVKEYTKLPADWKKTALAKAALLKHPMNWKDKAIAKTQSKRESHYKGPGCRAV